ncbi:MAG: hypothetical protein ACIAXF_00530 [Phycisphaerales bacterium JB063]
MRVTYKMFRSAWDSWDRLFEEASGFASALPEGRLINISHSEFNKDGVVVVWYYTD